MRFGSISILCSFFLLCSLSAEAQKLENPTKLYTGFVTAEGTGVVVNDGMLFVYEDPYPTVVSSSRLSSDSGAYRVLLDPSKIYRFVVVAPGYYLSESYMSTPPGLTYEELSEPLTVAPIKKDTLLYSGRMFADGSDEFNASGDYAQAVDFLSANPTIDVAIEVGLEKDEVDPLTKKRVDAIKEKFRQNNISTTRIQWVRKVGEPVGQFVLRVNGFRSVE